MKTKRRGRKPKDKFKFENSDYDEFQKNSKKEDNIIIKLPLSCLKLNEEFNIGKDLYPYNPKLTIPKPYKSDNIVKYSLLSSSNTNNTNSNNNNNNNNTNSNSNTNTNIDFYDDKDLYKLRDIDNPISNLELNDRTTKLVHNLNKSNEREQSNQSIYNKDLNLSVGLKSVHQTFLKPKYTISLKNNNIQTDCKEYYNFNLKKSSKHIDLLKCNNYNNDDNDNDDNNNDDNNNNNDDNDDNDDNDNDDGINDDNDNNYDNGVYNGDDNGDNNGDDNGVYNGDDNGVYNGDDNVDRINDNNNNNNKICPNTNNTNNDIDVNVNDICCDNADADDDNDDNNNRIKNNSNSIKQNNIRQINKLLNSKYNSNTDKFNVLTHLGVNVNGGKWIKKTNTACLWCCHLFTSIPWGIPYKFVNDKFQLFGNFCMPNCALAYILQYYKDDDSLWEKSALLNLLYFKVIGHYKNLQPSFDKMALILFGGTLNINEYRTIISKNDKSYSIEFPPCNTIIPILEEIYKKTALSNTFIPVDNNRIHIANTELKLKRSKPIINHKNTIDFCLGNI